MTGEKYRLVYNFKEREWFSLNKKDYMNSQVQIDFFLNINDCIIILEPDYRVIFWNKGAQKLLGWVAEEVMGRKLDSVLNINIKDLLIDGHECHEGQYDIKLSNGEKKTIKLSITNIKDDNGSSRNIVVAATDMSELVKSKNQAKQANLAKSEFLANISHEMRNSLVGILGFCEILSEEKLHFRKKEEGLKTIQSCAQQLLGLVNSMLDLSKIEIGQVEINKKCFNLKTMIKQVAFSLQPDLKKKGLGFQLDFHPDVPENILGDETKIRQILSNIVVNAVKYTDCGYIKIVVSKHFSEDFSMFPLRISVYDTGIGIYQDDIHKIFEPFIRAKSHSNREYEGTGLGLAISKQLVEIMGGTISYEPNKERGSVFSFVLPVQEVPLVRKIGESKSDYGVSKGKITSTSGLTILLAEDIKANRKLIKYMLEDIGHNVITAKNGEECINILKNTHPDIILMDMQMPVLNGYETTNIIRQSRQWKRIPVVALTAYAMTGDIEKCMQVGCDYYLSKPFTREQLYHVLSQCSGIDNVTEGIKLV